jgi:tetratricopeptide (TPR) repeat protein
VMLLPTSNLIVTIGSIMAERFLYLPSIGFCAAAAVVLWGICAKLRFRWALPLIVISALGIRTFARNSDWQDDLGLWESTVAASPGSSKAHMSYGDAILADAQRKNQALELHIDEAIMQEEIARSILEPEPPLPLKWQNLNVYLRIAEYYRMKGQFLEEGGHHDEGLQFYEKSLTALTKAQDVDRFTNQASREFRLRRGIAPREIPDTGNPVVYQSLCLTYGKLGQWEKCIAAGRYLQHIAPQQVEGYQFVGAASFNLGRYPDAAVQFLAGLLVNPENADWLMSLRATYENLGVQPNPVVSVGAGFSLNRDVAPVHEQLNEAAVMVVRLLEEAKKPDEARDLRDRIIKQYSVPLEVFSRKS